MFQSDEILALTMGLMFSRRLHLTGITAASERAIQKIEREKLKEKADEVMVRDGLLWGKTTRLGEDIVQNRLQYLS